MSLDEVSSAMIMAYLYLALCYAHTNTPKIEEEVYPHAEEFLPERWYLYPDMVTEKSAWAPFSVGPFGCIGKPLALLSLRTTIAQIVMRFDIGFPDDETDRGTRFETNCRDHFTMSLAELKICLKRRKK